MSDGLPPILAPVPLSAEHQLEGFQNRHQSLVDWLLRRARQNEAGGGSRCFVSCTADNVVVGYYCLAAGSVVLEKAPGKVRRNMPDPVPVIVLGRLATDTRWERRGIGSGLLNDAIDRTQQAARHIGARAMMCHAIDEDAKRFYLKAGFIESPIEALTVFLPISAIQEAGNP